MGRHVPPAPGRRRLHDADQGARGSDDRRPGPRDRCGGRRLRRGPRRQPGVRQPLRRPHDPPGHSAALDPHRRRAPDLAALLGRRVDDRAGVRRLRPQRLLLPGVGHRRRGRSSTPCRSRGPSRPSSPATASTPTCRASSRSPSPAASRTAPGSRSTTSACGRREQADGAVGFNVLIGGGLSDGERMASDIDVFVRPDQAVELSRGVAQVFGELGNRENRGLARMRYLVQELGPGGLPCRSRRARPTSCWSPAGQELTDRLPGRPRRRPPPEASRASSTSAARFRSGACTASSWWSWPGWPRPTATAAVRLGTDQNFILTGVPEDRVDDLLAEPLIATLLPVPRSLRARRRRVHRLRVLPLRRGRDQGAGGQVGTQPRRAAGGGWPETAVRGDAGVIRMHFSGCSASCAQPQIADIGFRGDIAHVDEHIEEAVDIGLGGSLGPDAAFIDWLVGARPGRPCSRSAAPHRRPIPGRAPSGGAVPPLGSAQPPDELRSTLVGAAGR